MSEASRTRPSGHARLLRLTAGLLAVLALGYYYVAGAVEHANTVNTFKARGDQSAYLGEAKQSDAKCPPSRDLTLIISVGYFVFKAGYGQLERLHSGRG
jgi:hypothetical protein